ncbi:MAG: DUF222 domain-containing protein [Pseudonocardiaceae bacterium]
MTGVEGPVLEGLDDQALLGLAKQTLIAVGKQPLGAAFGDAELAESVGRLHELETIVAAEKLRRIAEVDVRQAWRGEGARSMADLLARRLRLTRGEARAQTDTAIGLASLPEAAAALRNGQIGLGQAQVATQLRPDAREDLDRLVASDGGELDRRQLRQRVDAWTHTVDPEALAGRERRAWVNRRLSVTSDTADGSVRGQFQLDPVGGATLTAALDPLARRTGADDDRTYSQRMADALVELARRSLDAGELPQVAVQRSQVILIATVEELKGEAGASATRLDGVGPVSSATARMVCCDGEVTPVFMTRNGAGLDVGRTTRTPTRKQRLAVIARDRACIGCGAPAARCQVHHVRFWLNGGPTDESNICILCWSCHDKVHQHDWLIIRGPDGRYTMAPPDP